MKKRFGLGLLQQLMAMGITIAIAGILFHSFLTAASMYGTKTYRIDVFNTEKVFEDSPVYQEIFRTAVSDITKLVVIKGWLETEGEFDPDKKIDVTRFAARKGTDNGCPVTAVYALEDLIKWGKSGIEYNNRVMSMSDFLNYFGPVTASENFGLDENGQLFFKGFLSGQAGGGKWEEALEDAEAEDSRETEENARLLKVLEGYTDEQLEDMAFSFMMAEYSEEIGVSREDDGSLNVYFPMIVCRHETVDGEKQLISYADNWVDYMKLQANLADAIATLSGGYQQYQDCNELYQEGNTNLRYMVRMMTEQGMSTYGNVSELEAAPDSAVTEYFSEYRSYLIYYPDSLEFTGNTVLSEEEIRQYIEEYAYAYPETTHIWIGVDSSYAIAGDAFYNANRAFERIVPNIGFVTALIIFQSLVWLGIFLYLTVSVGTAFDENGERIKYIGAFDRIWTEVWVLLCIAAAWGTAWGYRKLQEIIGTVYAGYPENQGSLQLLFEYGSFAVFGFSVSLAFCLLWYSLVRRIRYRNLWKNSFLQWLLNGCIHFVRFIFRHRNSAVSTLLPYNLFLFANLAGVFCIVVFRENRTALLLTIPAIVLLDVVVGMLLFKHNGEQIEIVEGINRIRDGEVEFKLDTARLHGSNKEMADAVNNIGEGIRKAVKTSMKDEQMKTDLITNVSHDIKTPLTSIINYVDLLKRLKIEEEPAKGYIDILENKAQRLKQLTDDLVEASKISSGNIELSRERLNLAELLNQSLGEFSEKLEERRLQVIFDGGDLSADIYADSRRMWRVIENLFNNIYKYAMEGTRVYIDLTKEEKDVKLSIKNISRNRMNISPDELTERFIRGDVSRSAEGSGLGLSIAKSLTRLQGGEFSIYLDGDLFKVVISFPEYPKEQVSKAEN